LLVRFLLRPGFLSGLELSIVRPAQFTSAPVFSVFSCGRLCWFSDSCWVFGQPSVCAPTSISALLGSVSVAFVGLVFARDRLPLFVFHRRLLPSVRALQLAFLPPRREPIRAVVKYLFPSVLYARRLVSSVPALIREHVLPRRRWLSCVARGSLNQSVY
jgi:hypothetical protein